MVDYEQLNISFEVFNEKVKQCGKLTKKLEKKILARDKLNLEIKAVREELLALLAEISKRSP